MAANRKNSTLMKAFVLLLTACLFAASMLREHHHDCSGAPCLSLNETSHAHAHHSHGCDDSTCPLRLSAAVSCVHDQLDALHFQGQQLSQLPGIMPPDFHSELTTSAIDIYLHYVVHLCRWLPQHSVSRGPPSAVTTE